jgi:hypothetical protein
MSLDNKPPSVSGEIRAVQAELADLRDGAKAPAVPRTSKWAAVHQSRWTPAAVMAIIASAIPLVQQWQTQALSTTEIRECSEQNQKLEARISKLERRLKHR